MATQTQVTGRTKELMGAIYNDGRNKLPGAKLQSVMPGVKPNELRALLGQLIDDGSVLLDETTAILTLSNSGVEAYEESIAPPRKKKSSGSKAEAAPTTKKRKPAPVIEEEDEDEEFDDEDEDESDPDEDEFEDEDESEDESEDEDDEFEDEDEDESDPEEDEDEDFEDEDEDDPEDEDEDEDDEDFDDEDEDEDEPTPAPRKKAAAKEPAAGSGKKGNVVSREEFKQRMAQGRAKKAAERQAAEAKTPTKGKRPAAAPAPEPKAKAKAAGSGKAFSINFKPINMLDEDELEIRVTEGTKYAKILLDKGHPEVAEMLMRSVAKARKFLSE